MTTFENPADYTWICDGCRATLAIITQQYEEDMFGDTDDPEAPIMRMYDNALYCGGRACTSD
jgi:hypothetical protein